MIDRTSFKFVLYYCELSYAELFQSYRLYFQPILNITVIHRNKQIWLGLFSTCWIIFQRRSNLNQTSREIWVMHRSGLCRCRSPVCCMWYLQTLRNNVHWISFNVNVFWVYMYIVLIFSQCLLCDLKYNCLLLFQRYVVLLEKNRKDKPRGNGGAMAKVHLHWNGKVVMLRKL